MVNEDRPAQQGRPKGFSHFLFLGGQKRQHRLCLVRLSLRQIMLLGGVVGEVEEPYLVQGFAGLQLPVAVKYRLVLT